MRLRIYKDKGIWYIIIAILCLVLFFVGFRIISKLSNDFAKDDNEEVVEAFNYISHYNGENENSLDKINTTDLFSVENEEHYLKIDGVDNFFLKIIINSNSYMKVMYYQKYKNSSDKGFVSELLNSLKSYFQMTSFLKAQIESILNKEEDITPVNNLNYFSTNETKDNENQNIAKQPVGSNEDGEVKIKEDIIFIEDPFETNEGDILTDKNIELKMVKKLKVNKEKPYILIYHTHGTEAYLPIRTNRFHTTKRDYNVIKIGDIITEVLKEKGHNVKHIDIYHDIPSYNQSYTRSLSTVKEIINKDKNIKIIFDIHRDGIPEDASYIKKALAQSKVKINGVDVATYTFVIGPENPNKDEILNFAKYIKEVSDKMYPGLCKGIVIKPYGKFNQYVKDHYALIEVGSNLNTIEEAKRSAKLIGNVLDMALRGIIE
ncbi:stage II sporulation protein P [Caloranaerobacter ferrireducens]|uniref:stage II sporulation protein P n=1 Tax=Caloranaerobacter ferrireducens TaxID=1323370 RepID=UPI00084D6B6D|nr:stage II sporulation protein P [Caloranaerobacter ferrireducens]